MEAAAETRLISLQLKRRVWPQPRTLVGRRPAAHSARSRCLQSRIRRGTYSRRVDPHRFDAGSGGETLAPNALLTEPNVRRVSLGVRSLIVSCERAAPAVLSDDRHWVDRPLATCINDPTDHFQFSIVGRTNRHLAIGGCTDAAGQALRRRLLRRRARRMVTADYRRLGVSQNSSARPSRQDAGNEWGLATRARYPLSEPVEISRDATLDARARFHRHALE